jgi:hypothetical protein
MSHQIRESKGNIDRNDGKIRERASALFLCYACTNCQYLNCYLPVLIYTEKESRFYNYSINPTKAQMAGGYKELMRQGDDLLLLVHCMLLQMSNLWGF